MRFRNGGDAAHPLRRRGVQTAFALHRFDQYGGRRIQTAGWIVKALFEQRRRIDIRPIIAVIGLMRDMVPRYAGAATFCGVAGAGKRAPGHRSEEHTSELQSLMRLSYSVSCLKNTNKPIVHNTQPSYLTRLEKTTEFTTHNCNP